MQGCVLILQDVPENTEIGIDLKFWRVGKRFRGIKNIPAGFHYVYFSAVDKECKSGQRIGFCEWFPHSGFIMKKWLPEEEDFEDIRLTSVDIDRLTDNFNELSMYLGPYPSEHCRDWIALTNFISPSSLDRLLPECGRINSCAQFLSQQSSSQQRLALRNEISSPVSTNPEDLLPKLDIVPGTEIRFSHLPRNPLFPPDSEPLDITAHGIDQTYTLDTVLNTLSSSCETEENRMDRRKGLLTKEREILAELQFSYVAFLLNHVLDGWWHWRRIVRLLANCEQAVRHRPQLYTDLLTVLYHQLCSASQSKNFLESDSTDISTAELADLFFSEAADVHQVSSTEPAFLPSVMRKLLRNILYSTANSSVNNEGIDGICGLLHQRAEGFCHSLEQRFHWGITPKLLCNDNKVTDVLVDDVDWDGDEAPVIVQM
ncbi:hypothetical protein P879_08853 [Paragonimus westermani]|uniref:Protein AAR2 homolog n=1 Tax=Paragonimus westermani TaxID=34504 RepID=A0A8T0D549_9TREM|nr:hypothetical protein P879_08853 [Paragonimus westermani]